ncbi:MULTISPECIES: YveK family protein [Paenibacillus]|uniref:LPS biosynthesis protein n=1 Tax=Paenibacillus naphthalenovorans TaxID=162209 RepID=A0A0U2W5L3_9BACL|nr:MULTISPECIES: Wzz/FepE/Etk N-terminal domain-containing protein [Paenibacillus]ALS20714.1 LPS biosynthesis protein [Paenibacillus naphthalenovorans]GCL70744.1 lipopolysaccharide biosynthesis protein [Paenibacillus naphthalenovorans]SDI24494.1 Capsular polysaccharide biosynthesis protein [Paenibacillus naphthalenovorans]
MELELKEYFNIIKKRIWMLVVIVLVSCITTGIVSYYYLKPVYSASTKLIVNKSNEISGLDTLTTDLVRSNIMLVNTYKEIMKTPAILDYVAADYPELEMTTEQLINKIKVSSVNDTQVITVSAEDYSHAKAVMIVNAVSEVFKSQIPQIMKVDNVMILNAAKQVEHPVPVKPQPELNLVIAFVVSLMAAIGLIFLLEYLDDTIKTEADVQNYLQLPVLVTINKFHKDEFKNNKIDESLNQQQVGEKSYANLN